MEKSMSIFLKKGRANKRPKICSGAVVAVLGTCLIPSSGFAASHGDHGHEEEKRHAESHEHGAAELAIVVDGSQVFVDFKSPAMNLVGFEHEAEDPGEVAAVEHAILQLHLGADLIELGGTECTLTEVDVKAEGLLADTHDDDHDEHHDEKEAHSEFEASYVFNCTDPNWLMWVSVSFFNVWPGIEEIETVFLSGHHQIAVELTASNESFASK
jgi:uncharacterized protein DUF2796